MNAYIHTGKLSEFTFDKFDIPDYFSSHFDYRLLYATITSNFKYPWTTLPERPPKDFDLDMRRVMWKVIPIMKKIILTVYEQDTIYEKFGKMLDHSKCDKIIEQYDRCYVLTKMNDAWLGLIAVGKENDNYIWHRVISISDMMPPILGVFHYSLDLRVIEIYDQLLNVISIC